MQNIIIDSRRRRTIDRSFENKIYKHVLIIYYLIITILLVKTYGHSHKVFVNTPFYLVCNGEPNLQLALKNKRVWLRHHIK